MMPDFSEKLSAYLDGELSPEAANEVEQRLETDVEAKALFDRLVSANDYAKAMFAEELSGAVPLDLVKSIKETPLDQPAVTAQQPIRRPIWQSMAAGLVLLGIGGIGGYQFEQSRTPAPPPKSWLAAIAEYHAIYAGQERHLVEVDASESDHIEAWLGRTVGVTFSIPDLSSHGLNFEGGRLVVANGKPVAQLMYRLEDGTVVALCLQASSKDPAPVVTFNERTIDDFDFVSWTNNGADYVVIAPTGQPDLQSIATTASSEV